MFAYLNAAYGDQRVGDKVDAQAELLCSIDQAFQCRDRLPLFIELSRASFKVGMAIPWHEMVSTMQEKFSAELSALGYERV